MKKVLAFLAVAAMTLTAFAGTASASVYLQYWEVAKSNGWMNYGNLPGPNYVLYGKLNYMDHMVWKEYDGVIYVPTHENWHVNWMTKLVENNGKPAVFIQYHFQYHLLFTPSQTKEHYMGVVHAVDPQASEDNTEITENPSSLKYGIFYGWGLWNAAPAITAINDDRQGTPYPTEDTIPLIDVVFQSIDISIIPLINQIEIWTPDGYFNIHVTLLE